MTSRLSRPAWLVVVLLVASGCGGTGARPSGGQSPAAPPGPGMETVTYDDAGHEMDLYLPAGGEPAAMVLLVPGVSPDPSPKDHAGFAAWGARLAAAGVVAAVPNHDAVVGGSPAGVAQLRRAVRALRARVAELAPEPVPLVTMGFSAGGPDWVEASFDPANQPVDALVGFYAEIEPPGGDGTRGSLAHHLASSARPVLLAYGLADAAPGILSSLRAFRRAARTSDVDAAILTHPTAGHAFDVLLDDGRTRSIIRRTVDFVAAPARRAASAARSWHR